MNQRASIFLVSKVAAGPPLRLKTGSFETRHPFVCNLFWYKMTYEYEDLPKIPIIHFCSLKSANFETQKHRSFVPEFHKKYRQTPTKYDHFVPIIVPIIVILVNFETKYLFQLCMHFCTRFVIYVPILRLAIQARSFFQYIFLLIQACLFCIDFFSPV